MTPSKTLTMSQLYVESARSTLDVTFEGIHCSDCANLTFKECLLSWLFLSICNYLCYFFY